MRRLQDLRALLRGPVDIAPLVLFRVAFGAIMLWEVWRYLSRDWIYRYWIEPRLLFPYPGFEWVRPWTGDLMYWHFGVLGVLAVCIGLGLFYRVSTVLFFLGFTYVFLLDQTRYLNHFYLICLISFLLILIPAHRSVSLDAFLGRVTPSRSAPRWALWTLRFQIGVAYVFAGVAKLNSDWLRGEPMGIWLGERTSFPVLGGLFTERWMVLLMSYGGLLLDLLVVPLLLWRRTRMWAFAAALAFHLLNSQLFSIGIFPWFMLASTLLFFPPESHRKLLDWLLRRPRAGTPTPLPADSIARQEPKDGLVLAFLAVFATAQVLVPLRHLLYPGNVSWTEEGHNFSWHMKLRTKSGDVSLTVTNGRRTWEVDPSEYVTPRQLDEISTRPG